VLLYVCQSACEVAWIKYFKRRLPKMFYSGQWDHWTGSAEIANEDVLRKDRLFKELSGQAAAQVRGLRRGLENEPGLQDKILERYQVGLFACLWEGVQNFADHFDSLQLMSEKHKPPRLTRMMPPPPTFPYPQARTRITVFPLEPLSDSDGWRRSTWYQTDRWRYNFNLGVGRFGMEETPIRGGPGNKLGAVIFETEPGGSPCLTQKSFIPLNQILHPEEPVSLMSASISRNMTLHTIFLGQLLEDIEISPDVWLRGSEVPRVHLVIREFRRRKLFGLGRKVPCRLMYLLTTRTSAVELGLKTISKLPKREYDYFKRHDIKLDDDVVVFWRESADFDDEDGNGGSAPPEPKPAPQLKAGNTRHPSMVGST